MLISVFNVLSQQPERERWEPADIQILQLSQALGAGCTSCQTIGHVTWKQEVLSFALKLFSLGLFSL